MPVRILLADDHRMVRKGLVALLEAEDTFEVVGEADDGRVAVQMAGQLQPDVIVMDLDAKPQRHRCSSPDSRRIAQDQNHRPLRKLRFAAPPKCWRGASGYVFKQSAFEELATAIRTVVTGEIYLSPSLADGILADYLKGNGREPGSVFGMLSQREWRSPPADFRRRAPPKRWPPSFTSASRPPKPIAET